MKSILKFSVLFWTLGLAFQISCLKEPSMDAIPVTLPKIPATTPYTCDLAVRPLINTQLIPIGTLSQRRNGFTIASSGDKVLFAGGFDPSSGEPSSRVDIFDISSQNWSTAALSVPRYDIATASVGYKVFFAGGYNGDDILGKTYSTVDIYDASNNTWSVESMSRPMGGRAAVVLENKIFLAGGNQCSGIPCTANFPFIIDIFDPGSNAWSSTQLSEGREGLSAVSAGDKIYFAGGLTGNLINTHKIDIYNGKSATWSYGALTQARGNMASISIGNKIIFAGGSVNYNPNSNRVEIIDANTQTVSIGCLFQPNAWFQAVIKKDWVIFFTSPEWVPNVKDKFDIYDTSTNTWSIGVLNQNITGAGIISVNNTIYVAGGYVNGVLSNQVWKLEF